MTDQTEAPLPAAPPRRSRRLVSLAVSVGLAAMGMIAVVLIVLATMLSFGPLTLFGGREAAIDSLRDTFGATAKVEVGNVKLRWSVDRGPIVRVTGVEVEQEGRFGASVPQVDIAIDGWRLLGFEAVARHITVSRPMIRYIEIREEAPGVAKADQAPITRSVIEDLVTGLAPVAQVAQSGLESVSVSDGVIEFVRRDGGYERRWQLPDVSAELAIGADGSADLKTAGQGVDGRWTLSAARLVRPDGSSRITGEATDIIVSDWLADLGPHMAVGSPLYPGFTIDIDPEGRLTAATATLGIGKGVLRFGPLITDRLHVDEAQFGLAWEPNEQRFAITRSTFASGANRIAVEGTLTPPKPRDPTPVWRTTINLVSGQLAPEAVALAPPLKLGSGTMEMSFDPRLKVLTFERGRVSWRDTGVQMTGAMNLTNPVPSLTMDLQFGAIPTTEIKQVWPSWVAPPARTWFLTHAEKGRALEGGRIKLDLPKVDDPSTWGRDPINLAIRFEGLEIASFGDVPPVGDARGLITIRDRKLLFAVERGSLVTHSNRRANVSKLDFTLDDVAKPVPYSQTRMQIGGDIAALAEIADADPIFALKGTGIEAGALTGTASGWLQTEFALEADVKPEKARVKAELNLDGFASAKPIDGRKISGGKLKLLVEGDVAKIVGKAQVDGLAIDLDLVMSRGGGAGDRRGVKVVLDDDGRKKLGADLGDLIKGKTPISLNQGQDGGQKIEVDLTQAKLFVPVFSFTKGAGVPGKASFDLTSKEGQGGRIDNLVIESEGVDIRGALQFDAGNQITRAEFGRFALRKGDEAKLRFSRGANGAEVGLDIGGFDARGFLLGIKKGRDDPPAAAAAGGPAQGRDANLTIRAARLTGFNNESMTDTVVEVVQRKGVVQKLTITGRFGGGRSIDAQIRSEGSKRTLVFTTDDLGALLRFLDIYGSVEGGNARITANLTGPGASSGRLEANRFRIKDDQNVQRITSEAATKARTDSAGAGFDKMVVQFSTQRGQVNILDAVLRGPEVGAIANGQIDIDRGRMLINGTYIPAYGLNNLLSRIPLLGEIATGGRNEGLLGVTFRVSGPVEDPVLQVNPMSAIAPGIFRKIFEYRDLEEKPRQGGANPPSGGGN
ncbi:MAG: hypothetical protein JNM13_09920 [Hyphomicrobiaceae bacterium]|nr:hypothetical protein [Hyphomicrobiaceae bacterium]